MINKAMIEEMLRNNPLSLLSVKDEQVINQINNLLPYSTGFDIECHKDRSVYDERTFRTIPDIMNVQNDDWEQRYRIPNGLRGIICLYNLSIQLKVNSLLNPKSSIHYHIDCTDCKKGMQELVATPTVTEYILSELDTWLEEEDKEEANKSRYYGHWFKYNDLGTVEFRLGEMTFEYSWMLKRILHCQRMIKGLKEKLNVKPPTFEAPDIKKLLAYEKTTLVHNSKQKHLLSKYEELQAQLDKHKEEAVITIDPLQEILPQVRNRVTKIQRNR